MADGIPGRVDEMRPESGFPVCAKVEGRVLLLKGYGNAIVPPLAAEFVKCFMEAISCPVVS
jgi:DNA (cytosine-5)-methyltransferase 1